MKDVHRNESRVFDRSLRELAGVELNVEGQLTLLDQLQEFYREQPFSEEPRQGLRYCFNNWWYPGSDAILLYCMIRFARPKQIIEIGSGFSSFVMLDTNDLFFDDRIRFTFIEPHAKRLRSRLKEKDSRIAEIVAKRVQEVDLSRFRELGADDILFVDSSHVAKVGSDVNHILFEILPRLSPGVFVHFHDVLYPFEYPQWWLECGFYWNEPYMLRAFLQYNSAFRIRLWNDFLMAFHPEKFIDPMPLCMKHSKSPGFWPGVGGSLWLQRL